VASRALLLLLLLVLPRARRALLAGALGRLVRRRRRGPPRAPCTPWRAPPAAAPSAPHRSSSADRRLPPLPLPARARAQGFNAVLRTTHRQNFLVPPRAHRSFPLAELL
jgi:hypothetical protein